ncbi:hypothetical protein [Streptomyces sp. DT171]|uniref:hypothetical protein n=1 Tax=Streptomyces sp. DT171 TaxID=3416524 RepID=UPI003CEF55D1
MSSAAPAPGHGGCGRFARGGPDGLCLDGFDRSGPDRTTRPAGTTGAAEGERTHGSHTFRRGARTRAGSGTAAVAAAALAAALPLTGCSTSDDEGKNAAPIDQRSRSTGPYGINPDGGAAGRIAAYTEGGDGRNAELIKKIAFQPVGE